LQLKWCVCASIAPVTLSFNLLVFRHWKESWRTSNTGRLANLAIENASIVDYGAPNTVFEDSSFRAPNTFLLFPSLSHSHGLLETATEPQSVPLETLRKNSTSIANLVAVDASWGQARKLVRRVPALKDLPRVSIQPAVSGTTRLRRPPFPGAMATIEAISAAVRVLDGPDPANTLDSLFACFVQNARAQRGGDGLDSRSEPTEAPHTPKDPPTT